MDEEIRKLFMDVSRTQMSEIWEKAKKQQPPEEQPKQTRPQKRQPKRRRP